MVEERGEKKFNYIYDNINQVVYKRYYGIISIEDITSSWNFAFGAKLFPEFTKRFILDYRLAQLDFNEEIHMQIASYYQEKLSVFRESRIAIIVTDPIFTAISVLFGTLDHNYLSKPFSTEKEALKWVLA
jgi:hypothetical protein